VELVEVERSELGYLRDSLKSFLIAIHIPHSLRFGKMQFLPSSDREEMKKERFQFFSLR